MATGRAQLRSWKPGLDHGSRWGLHFDQEKKVFGGWALYFDQEKSVLGDTCCRLAWAKQSVASSNINIYNHSVLLGQAIRIAIRFGILTSLTQGFGQVQNSEIFDARVWAGPKF